VKRKSQYRESQVSRERSKRGPHNIHLGRGKTDNRRKKTPRSEYVQDRKRKKFPSGEKQNEVNDGSWAKRMTRSERKPPEKRKKSHPIFKWNWEGANGEKGIWVVLMRVEGTETFGAPIIKREGIREAGKCLKKAHKHVAE